MSAPGVMRRRKSSIGSMSLTPGARSKRKSRISRRAVMISRTWSGSAARNRRSRKRDGSLTLMTGVPSVSVSLDHPVGTRSFSPTMCAAGGSRNDCGSSRAFKTAKGLSPAAALRTESSFRASTVSGCQRTSLSRSGNTFISNSLTYASSSSASAAASRAPTSS